MIRNQNLSLDFTIKLKSFLILLSASISILTVFFPKVTFALLVITGGGMIAVWVSKRWPEVFLIAAVSTNFLKSAYIPGLAVGEFGATPYLLFTSLAALGFSIQIVTRKRKLVLPQGLGFLLVYITSITLSLLVVESFRLAIGAYVRTLYDLLLMFLLVQMLTSEQKVHKFMIFLLIQAAFVVTWGLLAGIELEISNVPRNSIFFWQQFQKNDFAAYLGIVLVLALATAILAKTKRIKLLALSLLPLVPIGWMFTFSRGGFLSIIACLFLFMSLERNKRLFQQSIIVLVTVGILGLLLIAFSPSQSRDLAIDGLASILTGESDAERHTETIAFRLELAKSALDIILEHPILGVGFNQWQLFSPITTRVFDPQAGQFRETGYSVHNRLLLITVDSGFIALLGYLGFVTVTLINGYRTRSSANIYLRGYLHVFIAAVVGMQIALLFAPYVVWEWASIGILIGITNTAKTR